MRNREKKSRNYSAALFHDPLICALLGFIIIAVMQAFQIAQLSASIKSMYSNIDALKTEQTEIFDSYNTDYDLLNSRGGEHIVLFH